ncbi:winged helix-turn-helix domain-containing protein [Pseudoalteromonas denitrificans]|jgi:DNA-binding winged helix-turn-helix (wHTH) protein|uniref:DNA-binding winged helix-turn-helix (WHTH) domain-containing protein n=1 Tax=Pseudoalteromonas denitrificans DSM 6059 TaxID=1123010 RepID=A0A1I1J2N3_9GAMM|nr:winged helix-turn-helix domain-containing protein [Pseudoalteromonas denitrificans]SFC42774.1 DNA-binding winged helix-turn-helix (wHTH) domain-containing protein [Pseudoalteromonas denitrificans DSM 6059]
MSQYKFAQFQFNSQTYRLTVNQIKHDIRPKTALLLAYLIENRHKIISKKELFLSVWHTEHVQDHTLFQVISEIRKLSKIELIRTQPNLGYQWVAVTNQLKPKVKKTYLAIAASLTFLITSSMFLMQENQMSKNESTLPALSAYSKGVIALEKKQYLEAEKWLKFSLNENPSSVETKFLLAESLFQQQNLTASELYAREILNNKNQSSYNYSMASDLMSRIYAQQGLVFDALQYAINGANALNTSHSICTIAATDERIQVLLNQIDNIQTSTLLQNKLTKNNYKSQQRDNKLANQVKPDKNYLELCEQVKKTATHNKQALCIELQKPPFLVAMNTYTHLYRTS